MIEIAYELFRYFDEVRMSKKETVVSCDCEISVSCNRCNNTRKLVKLEYNLTVTPKNEYVSYNEHTTEGDCHDMILLKKIKTN